jgi:hypothetical protein
VHTAIRYINQNLDRGKYCTAVFLDIAQAFDKVRHPGLLYKIKKNVPYNIYKILKSYLQDRHFLVKQNAEYTNIYKIQSGVPQSSVLGPVMYLLYSVYLPTIRDTTIAAFADDINIA